AWWMSERASAVSATSAAPMFSWSRCSLRVPGIGTINGFCALLFGSAPPQRVLALYGGHRLHGMRAADGIGGGLRHAEVLHLAGVYELLERAGDHHAVVHRRERFANEFLVDVRSVDLGGVEEGDAEVD